MVRSLMDLDSWFLSLHDGGSNVLPKTRTLFYEVVEEGMGDGKPATDSYTVMLPVGLKNHRKQPFTSDPFEKDPTGLNYAH